MKAGKRDSSLSPEKKRKKRTKIIKNKKVYFEMVGLS